MGTHGAAPARLERGLESSLGAVKKGTLRGLLKADSWPGLNRARVRGGGRVWAKSWRLVGQNQTLFRELQPRHREWDPGGWQGHLKGSRVAMAIAVACPSN